MNLKKITYSPIWNILLITIGSAIVGFGIKAVIIHHNFITGGVYGVSLLIYYMTNTLKPGIWFFILNLPLFVIGWFFVSKRFFFYSLYSVIIIAIFSELINFHFDIKEQIYAAIAGGLICGTGAGITLRTLGSTGGLDIIAVILHQKFNIGMGKFFLAFNAVLFSIVISYYDADIFIASLILAFTTSVTLEYVLSLFNQKKLVYIISDKSEEIAKIFTNELKQGATFIQGRGAYTKKDKLILMAITNNIQIKIHVD